MKYESKQKSYWDKFSTQIRSPGSAQLQVCHAYLVSPHMLEIKICCDLCLRKYKLPQDGRNFVFPVSPQTCRSSGPCRYFVKGKSLILMGVCFDVFKEEQTKEGMSGKKPSSSPQCLFWVAVERLPRLWWCGWASLSAAGDSPLDLSASLLTCVRSPWCDSQ